MSIQDNLALAEEAILHVRTEAITGGAANRRDDQYRTGGKVMKQVAASRHKIRNDHAKGMDLHTACVTRARANKVGNCEEQARVAFDYLVGHGGRNVALVDLNGWNHVFVVLGADRLAGCDYKVVSRTTAPPFGAEAAICDPWVVMAWDVARWPEWMKTTLYLTLGIDNQRVPDFSRAVVKRFR